MTWETGQDLSALLGAGTMQKAAKTAALGVLQDPEIQDEIRAAARPVLLEGAAYMALAVVLGGLIVWLVKK